MKYQQLVVNGCSYMEAYVQGNGHKHLAELLGIPSADSLAIGGSANSRILRTTLKHSYQTTVPTLYVLGMTFISRNEVPILKYMPGEDEDTTFEGRWVNPQNQMLEHRWEHFWSERDSRDYVDIQQKVEVYSLLDRTEDLMYRVLAAISDLTNRGHQVIMFQQVEDSYMLPDSGRKNKDRIIDSPRLALLSSRPNIINGFRWQAIQWQHEQGVPCMTYGSYVHKAILTPDAQPGTPDNIKHRQPGQHHILNQYLVDYIHNELHL